MVDGQGITILLTTHNLDEAELLCDRLAIMSHGHIQATGTVQELQSSSKLESRYVIQVSRLPENTRENLVSHFGENGIVFKPIERAVDTPSH